MNKYRNIPTTYDGHCFASKKEVKRYQDLRIMEKAGLISDLKLQPRFEIIPAVKWNDRTLRKRFYVSDFQYTEKGQTVIEDVKSSITAKNAVYTLKRQLFLIQYPEYYFKET